MTICQHPVHHCHQTSAAYGGSREGGAASLSRSRLCPHLVYSSPLILIEGDLQILLWGQPRDQKSQVLGLLEKIWTAAMKDMKEMPSKWRTKWLCILWRSKQLTFGLYALKTASSYYMYSSYSAHLKIVFKTTVQYLNVMYSTLNCSLSCTYVACTVLCPP